MEYVTANVGKTQGARDKRECCEGEAQTILDKLFTLSTTWVNRWRMGQAPLRRRRKKRKEEETEDSSPSTVREE